MPLQRGHCAKRRELPLPSLADVDLMHADRGQENHRIARAMRQLRKQQKRYYGEIYALVAHYSPMLPHRLREMAQFESKKRK